MTASPHLPVCEDVYHHLWNRPEGRYRAAELMADVGAEHDVQMSSRRGIVAPVGMYEATVDQLRVMLTAVNEIGEFQTTMAEQGNLITFMVGADFAEIAAKQSAVAASIWTESTWK